jgi:hypothetical protein
MADNNDPKLAVRVSDNEKWDRVGRLYRRPDFQLPREYRDPAVLRELLEDNKLVPSVTNVIGVRGAPHLIEWNGKQVAELAVEAFTRWPADTRARPADAQRWLAEAGDRFRDFWGGQGTNIHSGFETLSYDRPVSHMQFTEYEADSIEQVKAWLQRWQPQYEQREVTGFGHIVHKGRKLGFAGTIDAIFTINGKRWIVDYKCTTPDTAILLPNGSSIRADELQVGQEIVAYNDNTKQLQVSRIAWIKDNGEHPTIRITTSTGHTLTTTYNHPYLASRGNRKGFAKADQLRIGDNVYLAMGWNASPQRQKAVWNKQEVIAPYAYGMLWGLAQFNGGELKATDSIKLPGTSRDQLREEMSFSGFDTTNDLVPLAAGLNALAEAASMTQEQLLELINAPVIDERLFGARPEQIKGFMLGLQEVFANKEKDEAQFVVAAPNPAAIASLHQLYINSGQFATVGSVGETHYIEIPFTNGNTIYLHGDEAVKITDIEYMDEPVSTLAIEVEGTHTHVTAGLITHNTNRSGLHSDVALQLAAGARFTEITPDNQTLIPMPKIDGAVAIHISPKGVKVRTADISDEIFETFEAFRVAWNFHAFDGKFISQAGVLGPVLRSPEDLK